MQPDSHHTPSTGNRITDNRLWNPLSDDPVAQQVSSYAAFKDDKVIRPLTPAVDRELINAHHQLRHQILGQFFPCTAKTDQF
jgi:hypothetical protein